MTPKIKDAIVNHDYSFLSLMGKKSAQKRRERKMAKEKKKIKEVFETLAQAHMLPGQEDYCPIDD